MRGMDGVVCERTRRKVERPLFCLHRVGGIDALGGTAQTVRGRSPEAALITLGVDMAAPKSRKVFGRNELR